MLWSSYGIEKDKKRGVSVSFVGYSAILLTVSSVFRLSVLERQLFRLASLSFLGESGFGDSALTLPIIAA